MTLSQATTPHKRFISLLVSRHFGVILPIEMDLSLGMRKYSIIFTSEQGAFSSFRRELGRYDLLEEHAGEVDQYFTLEIPAVEKGKQVLESHAQGSLVKGSVE